MYQVLLKKDNGREYQKRLEYEYYNQIDGRLRAVYLELNDWMFRELGLRLIITCLNRTKEENKKVNGSEWSAHLFGRALDGRTRGFSDKEVKKIIEHLSLVWGNFLYVKHHNAGTGMHLHVNITYQYNRKAFDTKN